MVFKLQTTKNIAMPGIKISHQTIDLRPSESILPQVTSSIPKPIPKNVIDDSTNMQLATLKQKTTSRVDLIFGKTCLYMM